jgi:hypothetical protein
MNNAALAKLIVDRILSVRNDDERRETIIKIQYPTRTAIIRPWHMVKDAIEVIEEESSKVGRAG